MATARKYAGLPDLDEAPDVYETPDLADDISTIPGTSARSPSVGSDDGRTLDDEAESGIVRQKVDVNQAYARFQGSSVNAGRTDFSDRLNGSKRYYSTSKRKTRRGVDENGDLVDVSDDEEETLDKKLARLKREIEEARIELAEKDEERELFSDAPETKSEEDGEENILETINNMSQALDAVYTSRHGASEGPDADLSRAISRFSQIRLPTAGGDTQSAAKLPLTASSPEHQAQLSQALAKAAEFDGRLTFIEQALGVTGQTMPDQKEDGQQPILHTLSTLDRQIQTLTNSSTSVDAAAGKTKDLIKQAEHLLKVKSEYNAIDHPTIEDTENVSKINALYGTLSAIDSLAPTLPMVLDRLRTLRLLHTSAAGAGSTLDEMEKRQADQASEIRQWRDALDQLEKNIKASESGLVENVKNVGEWVKDLEARMTKLS